MQFVIPILAALSVFFIGGALLLARQSRRARLAARLALGMTASGRTAPGQQAWVRLLGKLGSAASGGKSSRSLREELARAGFHTDYAAATYIGGKLILLLMGGLLAFPLVQVLGSNRMQGMLLVGIAAATLFFIPNLVVASRRRQRRQEMTCHLPDAIDLLEIAVTAGMGLDQAWNSVTDEIRGVCPILSEEMALTNLELHLGAGRTEAMRHMADRTGVAELGSLVACMVQAERFGTSMREALRNFANNLRDTRSQRAQEAAERMAVKLLFPMVLFIFPPALMVMAGPAFLSLSKSLSGSY